MTSPISAATADHYTWGDPGNLCDGWFLLRSPHLTIIEERLPPGAAEVPHLHRYARQFFYVLAGEFILELSGHQHLLRPGQGLEVPPGAPHQALNRSSAEVRILVISQPPSHGDRFNC